MVARYSTAHSGSTRRSGLSEASIDSGMFSEFFRDFGGPWIFSDGPRREVSGRTFLIRCLPSRTASLSACPKFDGPPDTMLRVAAACLIAGLRSSLVEKLSTIKSVRRGRSRADRPWFLQHTNSYRESVFARKLFIVWRVAESRCCPSPVDCLSG